MENEKKIYEDRIKILEQKLQIAEEKIVQSSPKEDSKSNTKSSENKMIMISLHVSTMRETAQMLASVLTKYGFDVWICINLLGGMDFRHEITEAVKRCHVMILLMNESWASSGECNDEFALAKRLNLTSHESGRTPRTSPRLPILLPVAFKDLEWGAHDHVQLLASTTNFIVHDYKNLTSGSVDQTVNTILLSLSTFGLIGSEKLPAEIRRLQASGPVSATPSLKPKDQLAQISQSLQAFALSLQSIPLESNEGGHKYRLGTNYLGVQGGRILTEASGIQYVMCWSNSFEIKFTSVDMKSEDVKAELKIVALQRQVILSEDLNGVAKNYAEIPDDHPGKSWAGTLYERSNAFTGKFHHSEGLITGIGLKNKELINGEDVTDKMKPKIYKYDWILHGPLLVGLTYGDDSDKKSVLKLKLLC